MKAWSTQTSSLRGSFSMFSLFSWERACHMIVLYCRAVFLAVRCRERDSWICRTGICRTGQWRTGKWRTENDGVEQEQTYILHTTKWLFHAQIKIHILRRIQSYTGIVWGTWSNSARHACPDSTVARTTHYSSCVLWATPLALTPTRYSPANTPTVSTTTTTSSWHRLLPARRPQRRYQERQLLQTHHYGVVKYVCWHRSKALSWCPADTQDSARTVRVA